MTDDSLSLALGGLSAFVAAGAFVISVVKNREDAKRAREVSARAAWEKYLEMAFQNPELARANLQQFDEKTFEQYEWFVSRMLYAAEEVLLLTSDDRSWNDVIADQIGFHAEYISGRGAQYNGHYSSPLRALLKKGARNELLPA